MGETGKAGDVDKMVSDFLSELNALSDSMARAGVERASERSPEHPEAHARAEPEPAQLCAVATDGTNAGGPDPDTRSAEQRSCEPVAHDAVRAPADPECARFDAVARGTPAAEQISQPAPSNPVYYRNIDILLMDDAQPTAPKKRVEQDDDLMQSCRPLYRSRFYARRRRHIAMVAAASVLLLCAAGTLYILRPPGSSLERPGVGAASAEAGPPMIGNVSPAVPIDNLVAAYPRRAGRLGNKATVELDVEVDERGRAVRATPVSGPTGLRAAAVRAVTRCRFKPAQRDGVDIKSTVRVSVPFKP